MMSEKPAEAKSATATPKPDTGALSRVGLDDDVDKSLTGDLEPTKFVARDLFEHAPVAMILVDQAGKIRHINRETERLFGYSKEALVGELVEILVPFEARLNHEQLRRDFIMHPTTRPMAEARRLSARKEDGTEVPVEIALNPIMLETSDVGVILSVLDISALERAERAEFFVNELTHRARNMFAIVSAISRQIARYSTSISDFHLALEGRLNTLSTSYTVLEKENWQAAPISDLVRSQISFVAKQGIPQINFAGPYIQLQPTPAEYLGLAIHELATNAIKHGALSVPTGAVDIRWSVDEGEKIFQFHWMERNGPPIKPSERRGFGTDLLTSIVPAACGGTGDLAITPIGMSWNLNAPLAMLALSD